MSDVALPAPGEGWPTGYYPPPEVHDTFGYPTEPAPPPPDSGGGGSGLPDTATVTITDMTVKITVTSGQPFVPFHVDWGDGRNPDDSQTNQNGNAQVQHTYQTAATWTIVVTHRADNSLIGTVDVTVPGPP